MRLIDAEALLEEANTEGAYGYVNATQIANAPTIEAKPIVHAHWNDDGRCTNCGEHAPFLLWADTWHESEYCHGCGAQMDEEVE